MKKAISQLLYSSELAHLGPGQDADHGPADVMHILDRSQPRNREAGVTGVLLFDQNFFVQILEGDRDAVTAVFCRVAADPRHINVQLMSVRDVDSRDFPDWSMGFLAPSLIRQTDYERYLGTSAFDPTTADPEAVRALLIATHHQELPARAASQTRPVTAARASDDDWSPRQRSEPHRPPDGVQRQPAQVNARVDLTESEQYDRRSGRPVPFAGPERRLREAAGDLALFFQDHTDPEPASRKSGRWRR